MKKIIMITIFCIFIAIGGTIFIRTNFSSKKITKRNFIVVKGSGEGLYPYRQTYQKAIEAINLVHKMEDIYREPKKIFIKKGKSWEEVFYNTKIYNDTTIKIEL